ncbi:hypothetical protein MNBD_GAMMA26-2427 [hydrothermal vent metagenome]|uniref:Ancillary SecYEG translocon subunit n=1 Tax=hydrothermal vent metagenome TaxID=652676 RepID=A0A3B1BF29_9ZZZZ
MTAYQTEEEQVEALKRWWQENGKATIAGAVLGLGGIFGWQVWQQQQQSAAVQASNQYQELSVAINQGAIESAAKQAEILISERGDSAYAVFAALGMAGQRLMQGDAAVAKGQLRWALVNSKDDGIRQIARLRLARLLLSEGDAAGAAGLVAEAGTDSFAGELAQLRGDIALVNGDGDAARKAYQDALNSSVGNTELVQMKLDDLAIAAVE